MKIKVCGLKSPDNILAIAALPVDFIGLILYNGSPRNAASEQMIEWLEQNESALAGVKIAGVFVNAEIEDVLNAVHDYRLDFVQLHGDESPDYCRELDSFRSLSSMRTAKLIKAFRVDEQFDFSSVAAYASWCSYALFDTRSAEYGGSGRHFDWELLRQYGGPLPFLLSGGIAEEDAEALLQFRHPLMMGVDINSRFETAPAEKDVEKINRFIQTLRR